MTASTVTTTAMVCWATSRRRLPVRAALALSENRSARSQVVRVRPTLTLTLIHTFRRSPAREPGLAVWPTFALERRIARWMRRSVWAALASCEEMTGVFADHARSYALGIAICDI